MTHEERSEVYEELRRYAKQRQDAYEKTRQRHENDGTDGWNRPPAIVPRPPELSMGVFYDPEWNTR